jgi:hypothetical protein
MLLWEFHANEAFWKKCSVFAEFWTKKVARNLNLFEWWHIFFFSQNLFIKSVLAIGTLYSLIFCFFKVVYGIVFGVTPDIKIISFGVRQLKNRRVTPNGEQIKDKKKNFLGFLTNQTWQGTKGTVEEERGHIMRKSCLNRTVPIT